jgi:MYXO-CTERM domain-containing protein
MGTCSPATKGSAPQGGACIGWLCDGAGAGCPGSCAGNGDCATGYFCNGTSCIAKKDLGEVCSNASQCASDKCVDGVCCDGTCTGKCMACAAGNKEDGSLANNGKCGAAKKGSNPGSLCVTGSDPCGDQASCSGSPGLCAKGAAGTSCGPTTCLNGSVSGKVCNGAGLCTDQNNADCSPYVCKGSACASPCTADSDCVTDNYCSNGVCIPKVDNGKACTVANACKSSFCVDQVCCDAPCNGQCEACAETGSLGQCKPVAGKPRGTRTDCAGTTGDKCKGSCDGANKSACAYPASGTACKDASCSGDVSQPAGTCDGAGLCSLLPTQNCLPYACKSATGVCGSTCASDTDCAQGAKCDTNTGKCAVTAATCKDATTLLQPNGQSESCVPYKCVGGACQQQCSSGSDCAPGYVCQGTACVSEDGGTDSGIGGSSSGGGSSGGSSAGGNSSGGTGTGGGAGKTSDGGEDDGGCGCRVPAGDSGSSSVAWLLMLALAGLRRRRAA